MPMSSALCRAQEAHHHQLAAATDLDNARAVALRAASAWHAEAVSAERREKRQLAGQAPAADPEA